MDEKFISIPVHHEETYDCIVCGGGMSGIAAAIAASRGGLRVAIIEQMGAFGGVGTSCGVNHLLGGRYYYEDTGKIERKVGGIFDEISDRLIREGGAIDPDRIDIQRNPHGWYPRMVSGIPFDGNRMKQLLDTICLEEHIQPFLNTRIIGLQKEDDVITGLLANNKSGNFLLKGSMVIDATGDADIAAFAGCPFKKGRDEDGLMTPASLEFHVDRVDKDAYLDYQNAHSSPKLVEIIEDLQKRGIWDFPFTIFIAVQLNDPDVFLVNTIRQVGIDGTSGESITTGLMEGRRDIYRLHEIMKQHFPGFAQSRIRYIAEAIGIRETRRIDGLAYVTVEDALQGRRYPDCIGRTTYNFDLPDPKKPSYDPMMGSAATPNAKRENIVIEVPYGTLVPKGVGNLIVAGRSASVDREVLGPLRVMGPSMLLGQAAGTAAALCISSNIEFGQLDGCVLRNRLIDEGCLLS
jgi:hypothetical protein